VILAAANIGQAFAVTGDQVSMRIIRQGNPMERWWAQSGMVFVESDGNGRLIRFTGVTAFLESNHATMATLEGFLVCGP
jgi:hypothetical protein